MPVTETKAPALPNGFNLLDGVDPAFDPSDWRDRLTAAGNAYLLACAKYRAVPKDKDAVFATLPADAPALDRYHALEAASSDVRAAFSACCETGSQIARIASELVRAAPTENPVMINIIERAFTDAAMRERSEHLQADARAARYRDLEAQDKAADELKAAQAALAAAQANARTAGLSV